MDSLDGNGTANKVGRDDHAQREIHQATGMLAAEMDCTVDTALELLRLRAAEAKVPIEELAHQMVQPHQP